ncbi:2960_t:CDS:2 [Acaulospora colombiana]|uniref:2960_t:CDS:1 n=1 Tax=Acaulospora colombiana TaxID=27376 RepID=A0ACA9K2K1_9GLOM|nr:2960_t:CDS:2 [Acaulospora colombiana]
MMSRFKEYKDETDETRIAHKIVEARQALYRLKRANVFDLKAKLLTNIPILKEKDLDPETSDAGGKSSTDQKRYVVTKSPWSGRPVPPVNQKDRQGLDVEEIENFLGSVPVLRHESKKPDGGPELIARLSPISPTRIAVIGDRLLTDILFGNMNGMFTIFTKKVVSEKNDNKMAVVV